MAKPKAGALDAPSAPRRSYEVRQLFLRLARWRCVGPSVCHRPTTTRRNAGRRQSLRLNLLRLLATSARAICCRPLQAIGQSAVRKAGLILLPTMLATGMVAYIDRTNLAYAAASVKKAVHINNSQYGLASGILYLSYCFFQVRFLRLAPLLCLAGGLYRYLQTTAKSCC